MDTNDLLIFLFVVLLIGKLAGLIEISYFLVCLPLIFMGIMIILVLIIALVIVIIKGILD